MEQQDARGLVLGGMQAYRAAIQRDPVAWGEFRAQSGHLAVDLQSSFADPTLHPAARTDAGGGEQLLNPLKLRRFLPRAPDRRRFPRRAWPHQYGSSAAPRATNPRVRGCPQAASNSSSSGPASAPPGSAAA